MVDPKSTIDAAASTLCGVVREKLSLERQRDVNLKVLVAGRASAKGYCWSDPGARIGDRRSDGGSDKSSGRRQNSRAIHRPVEKQELERRFSERLLGVAQAAYERAREEAERQHVYIAVFVEPKKPEIAEYPRRVSLVAFVGMCAFALWSVMMLVIAGVRDHRNIG